jgi:acylphosphatase
VSDSVAKRVVVHGSVQGVFFRDTIRRRAESRGVTGWVRNCPDGTVEALFEGDPEAVDALVQSTCPTRRPRGSAASRSAEPALSA